MKILNIGRTILYMIKIMNNIKQKRYKEDDKGYNKNVYMLSI